MKSKRLMLIILLLICASMAIYSGFRILNETQEYRQGKGTYQQMQEYVLEELSDQTKNTVQEAVPDAVPDISEGEVSECRVDFAGLQGQYPGVVAWIWIDGTNVDYPVMQAEDNDYYLKRLPDGTWNSSGSIFMDCRNSADLSDWHTVIYGHNMRNDSMFAELINYQEQEFFEEHPIVTIETPQEIYEVELFSGYICSPDSDAWQLDFTGSEDFLQWCEMVKGKSCFETSLMPQRHESVITLSTCSYAFDEARFVVHGILRNVE